MFMVNSIDMFDNLLLNSNAATLYASEFIRIIAHGGVAVRKTRVFNQSDRTQTSASRYVSINVFLRGAKCFNPGIPRGASLSVYKTK